jgi:AcrR family transcriptional regulator
MYRGDLMSATTTPSGHGAKGSEPARPVRRDAARNRALLLQAADEVFADRGAEATLDEIAEHAGVGVGTAYRHFTSKQALLNALFETRMSAVIDMFTEVAAIEDPQESFEQLLVRAGEQQALDRGLREVLIANYDVAAIPDMRARIESLIEGVVARAHAAGVLRPAVTITDIPIMLWMVGSLTDYAGQESPELWRRYLDLLLDGVLAPGARRRAIEVPALDPVTIGKVMRAFHRPRSRR